ncbi:MAG: hypothetical protein U0S48_06980 [Solirubrobacteraceae bacterium]
MTETARRPDSSRSTGVPSWILTPSLEARGGAAGQERWLHDRARSLVHTFAMLHGAKLSRDLLRPVYVNGDATPAASIAAIVLSQAPRCASLVAVQTQPWWTKSQSI